MNSSLACRLFWKEYRRQRGLLFASMAAAVIAQFVLYLASQMNAASGNNFHFLATVLAACYSLGCGAVLFSSERNKGAGQLLGELAVAKHREFFIKCAFAVISSFTVFGLLSACATILRGDRIADIAYWTRIKEALFVVETLAWGVLFSLAVRDALRAILLAAVGVFAASFVVAPVSPFEFDIARSALLISVLVADVGLAMRWINGRPIGGLCGATPRQPGETRRQKVNCAEAPTCSGRQFTRLIWHEWQRVVRIWILLAGGALGLVLLPSLASWWGGIKSYVLIVPAVSFVIGLCVFRGDRDGDGRRFLVERGIQPATIWLSRQIAWCAFLIMATSVASGALVAVNGGSNSKRIARSEASERHPDPAWSASNDPAQRWDIDGHGQSSLLLAAVMIAAGTYGVGQVSSMFAGDAVAAVLAGAGVAGVLEFWGLAMYWLGVPLVLSVAPIAAGLLATTYVRASDWVLQRPLRCRRLRACVLPAVTFTAATAAVAVWRVWEVPSTWPGFSLEAHARTAGRAAKRKNQANRRAASLLESWQIGVDQGQGLDGTTQESQIEAWPSKRRDPRCVVCVHNADADTEGERLAIELLTSGQKSQARGQLDKALESYLAALETTSRLAEFSRWHEWKTARCLSGKIIAMFPSWAAQDGQSSESVRNAVVRVQQICESFPPPTEWMKVEHVLALGALELPTNPSQIPRSLALRDRAPGDIVGRACFWERRRAAKVLDAIIAERIQCLENVQRHIDNGVALLPLLGKLQRRANDYNRRRMAPGCWLDTTLVISQPAYQRCETTLIQYVTSVTEWRGQLIATALVGWRLEYGQTPSSLRSLVKTYFEALPLDPWSGEEFCYRPNGFPCEVDFANRRFSPGEPALWSVGCRNARIARLGDYSSDRPEYVLTSRQSRTDPPIDGDEQPAAELGMAFSIPSYDVLASGSISGAEE